LKQENKMRFSTYDKVLIKNTLVLWFAKILADFPMKNWTKGGLE